MSTHLIKSTLLSLGLNDKEIEIYLMLLSVGSSPASTLGNRTGISRSTAQYTCQQLVKKGIIGVSQKNNTFIYVAEPPEKLLFLIDVQQQELEQKKDQVHRIVGSLKSMLNPQLVLPKVQFFEGKAGMQELAERLLDMESPIDAIRDPCMTEALADSAASLERKRMERRIFTREIRTGDAASCVSAPKEMREVRTVPAAELPFTGDIRICGDMIGILSGDRQAPVGIAIRHRETAENFRMLFNFLWEKLDGGDATVRPS
jgi:sugar-specific transcriptional regulator TrmB